MSFKCPKCGSILKAGLSDNPMQCPNCGWESALIVPRNVSVIMQEHVHEQYEALARDVKSGAAFAGPEWHVAPVNEQPGDGFRAAFLVGIDLVKRAWWASPFHFWGQAGIIWTDPAAPSTVLPQSWTDFFDAFDADAPTYSPGYFRAPLGGVVESILRRRRRCVVCNKFFWRQGWWNPFAGMNIFEEHCSKACADEELDSLPH